MAAGRFTWEQRAVAGKHTWVLVRPGSGAGPQAPLPNLVKKPIDADGDTPAGWPGGRHRLAYAFPCLPNACRLLAARPLDRDMIEFNESDPHDLWPLIYKRSTPNLSILCCIRSLWLIETTRLF